MARTNKDDKLLDTGAVSTESEATDADNVDVSNDEDVADTDVDSTATLSDTVVEDALVAEDDGAAVSDTYDNTNITDDDSDAEILDPDVAVIERKVRSTNRLMKVYANANEKSKFHHFVGTYTITGVVKGDFKQIICNVPGIGKFTGYLLSR